MFKSAFIALVGVSLVASLGCARKPVPVAEVVAPPVPAASPAPAVVEAPAAAEVTTAATLTTDRGQNLETIQFSYDSSVLEEPARKILQKNAAWLLANPGVTVMIEGHCDERGAGEYNLALGEQRAQVVKTYLVTLGIPDERLNTISFGEEAPLDPGHDETAWAKNRRAAFNL